MYVCPLNRDIYIYIVEVGYAALSMSVSVDKIIFVVIVCNLLLNGFTSYITCNFYRYPFFHIKEALPGGAMSLVGIYPGRVPLRVLMNRYI